MAKNDEIFPVDENDTDVMVTIELEGEDLDCEIVTIFELNTQDYIVLLPVDEHGTPLDENLVYIYRYFEDEEGTPSIDNIVDDDEYERVSNYFSSLIEKES